MSSASDVVKPTTVFIARRSELTDRFDPEIVMFRRRLHRFKYPVQRLRDFLIEPPQYGAGERGVFRESESQPRYIRITDIDDDGSLGDELGMTAERVESRYLLRENDLLLARSGNTVGKSYLHKKNQVPYECLFAGYLIRIRLRADKLLPGYAFALTQLPYYKAWVRSVRRAAGQPNINAQEYANLEVPIPPIEAQGTIVALLEDAYRRKRARDAEARLLIGSIDDVVLQELGVPRRILLPANLSQRIFLKAFTGVTGGRWDPNYARRIALFMEEIKHCSVPVEPLRRFLAFVQYGISERATDDANGVPMLRMLNLQGGEWSLSDMKYIAMTEPVRLPYLLKHGDILFNRTNSKELVGKCKVFDLEGEYVFASYLMRARVKREDQLNPEYVVAYMACSLGRLQIDAVSRQIAGMTNINAEELRELLVPIPSRPVQDRIVDRVGEIRRKVSELRAAAITELEAAKENIERLIMEGIG